MQTQFYCLMLFSVQFIIPEIDAASNGVCYKQSETKSGYTSYYAKVIPEQYSVKCGFLKWKRCSRTKYVSYKKSKNVPAIYAKTSFCCTGYTGSPPNCNAICNPKCVHGMCTSPGRCTCESSWTGPTCRDDLNLVKWCRSISDRQINNYYQQKARSPFKVYCEGSKSNMYEWHNKRQTSHVAPLISADSNRCPKTYRGSLYEFWMLHPNVRKFCCYKNSNYHITVLEEVMKFKANFYQYVGGLSSKFAIELRKELKRLCSISLSDPFCPIVAALDTVEIVSKLPKDKSKWTKDTYTYTKAVLVSFVIPKQKYPGQYSQLKIDEDNVIIDCTNLILKYMQNNEISELRSFAMYLPANDAYMPTTKMCQNNKLCIFMKMVEQVRMYLDEIDSHTNPVLINGRKRLILNTAVDYREFLRQKQLDRILTVLAEQQSTSLQIANDLKQHTTTKFTELRSYFEKVETFNQQIASADIAYINGRIELYKQISIQKVHNLRHTLSTLLHQTFLAVDLNIVENTVYLALQIAEAANPLKFALGGGSVQDIMSAAASLANAIADRVKLKQVENSFGKLRAKSAAIGTKFEINDAFIGDILILIKQNKATSRGKQFDKSKSNFLQKYNDYNPQVTRTELAGIESLWHGLIDSACSVVDNIDTSAGAIVKGIIYDQGLCGKARRQASELVTAYDEIYTFQFDLIDATASYMRSTVSLDAAKEISAEFSEVTKLKVKKRSSLTILAMMGGLTYVTFKTHILQAIYLYCNVLEYMNGGRQPVECKGANTDLALLVANSDAVCHSHTTHFYHAPTKPSKKGAMDYMDINFLFSGSEMPFKIPSSQWLVDNRFIHADEKNDSFYVKRFEVYLPLKTNSVQMFRVTARPVHHNTIIPDSKTEYIITPDIPLVHEYTMGPSRLLCHNSKFSNPYTSCETSDVSEICQLSHGITHRLYPSIYSQWSISVKSDDGTNMTVPNPATDLSVVIGLELCKIRFTKMYPAAAVSYAQELDQCCPEGQYRQWNRQHMSMMCANCPPKSHAALAGFYCEKDKVESDLPFIK